MIEISRGACCYLWSEVRVWYYPHRIRGIRGPSSLGALHGSVKRGVKSTHPLGFKDGTPTWRSRDFWFGYTKAIVGFVELPSYCSSFARRSIDLGRYLSDMGCSPTLLWRRRKLQRSRGVTNEFRVNKQVYDINIYRYNKKQRCKSERIWVPPISAQGSVHVCIGNTQIDRFFPAMFHQFKRTCLSRVPVLTVENSWDI